MKQTFEVKIDRLIIVNGGVYYKDKTPITDYRGSVAVRQMPLNSAMMMAVPEGNYLVQLSEAPSNEMLDNYSSWKINQLNLMQSGSSLLVNSNPFGIMLIVKYSSQFERGAVIATIEYDDGKTS